MLIFVEIAQSNCHFTRRYARAFASGCDSGKLPPRKFYPTESSTSKCGHLWMPTSVKCARFVTICLYVLTYSLLKPSCYVVSSLIRFFSKERIFRKRPMERTSDKFSSSFDPCIKHSTQTDWIWSPHQDLNLKIWGTTYTDMLHN